MSDRAPSSGSATAAVAADPRPASSQSFRWWVFLLIVWSLSIFYSGSLLKRGWVPHDEGAFAQSADRVLHGELPHRDYTEIYTGGLAFLNAFAFHYLGENLATLRIVLFICFIAWVPVFYWIVSRLAVDWVAAAVTLFAVAWSLPNYTAAVPSWFNLFFATFGLASLFVYLDKHSPKWLLLAGLFGGFSFLAKTTAVYYAAGVMLFFLFIEQSVPSLGSARQQRRSFVYTSSVAIFVLALLLGLLRLISPHASPEEYVKSVVPAAALGVLLLFREPRAMMRTDLARFKSLFRMCIPFAIGFLIPLLVFLLPYVRGNALSSFARGVFILPFKRVSGAYMDPPEISTLLPTAVVVVLLMIGARLRGMARRLFCFLVAIAVAYYLFTAEWIVPNYRILWHAIYWLTPPLTLIGSYVLKSPPEDTSQHDPLLNRQLFLILAVSAFCGLIQYPFSAPIYFCYVAPLVILGAVALLRFFRSVPGPLIAVFAAGFFLFAVMLVTPGFIYVMGFNYQPDIETKTLALARAGNLRTDSGSVLVYERLIPLIRQHAGDGEIYAAPDCPQIYFLAGYQNPTRAMFDFFEDDYPNYKSALKLLDSRSIRVVVINNNPSFSSALPNDFQDAVSNRFPEEESIGDFDVHWRE